MIGLAHGLHAGEHLAVEWARAAEWLESRNLFPLDDRHNSLRQASASGAIKIDDEHRTQLTAQLKEVENIFAHPKHFQSLRSVAAGCANCTREGFSIARGRVLHPLVERRAGGENYKLRICFPRARAAGVHCAAR